MLPPLHPRENQLGRDVTAAVPGDAGLVGVVHLPERYAEIWRLAEPYLKTRNNDGHDSRREALSLDDALMKDADKLWRLTPHGVDTVMDWFGLDRDQAHRLIASRVHDHLLTDAGRVMARALGAVASVDTFPERIALG